jgi:uncharacterized SAM-binding protein YcdF (DUF218 family)
MAGQFRRSIMNRVTAELINTLGRFCGQRDVKSLDCSSLYERYGIDRADVMVLFGGSILAGGDVLAEAIRHRIASTYIIVGGAGHTTETLRKTVQSEYPSIRTDGLTEAEIFQKYLQEIHGYEADYLETRSTNCGNNITYLLDLMRENRIDCKSIILCQDATMQKRMDAGFRKNRPQGISVINYASYSATVRDEADGLGISEKIHGMWEVDRYINLLMGEVPRLRDDENGYGPAGKGFIAHVDIPEDVEKAFSGLKNIYGDQIREANPLYAQ